MKQYEYFIEKDSKGNLIKPRAKEGFLIKRDVAWIYDGDTPYLVLGPKDRYLDEHNIITKNKEELGKLAQLYSGSIITSDSEGTEWEYADVYDKYGIDKNLALFSLRLANIQADEIVRNKNFDIVKDHSYAEEATLFVESLVNNADECMVDFRIDKESGALALDIYGRPIGILYVRHGSQWINVNRSLLKNGLAETAYTEYSNLSLVEIQQWKNEGPERTTTTLEEKIAKELEDDREKYLGEFDLENEVVIGDTKFRIPPTHIQVTHINESNPATVLRHKTTLQGSVGHEIKQIQMEVYFNGLEDINGTPVKPKDEFATIIRDGETITPVYYVNGLRSLLAQFKLTPFLPIENEFLNLEQDVSAVTLQNITLTSVEGFPNVIKATLTFLEFNYMAYLDVDPLVSFSDVFDWKLFRFYYQRLLKGTGMKHNGTQLPLVKNSLNTNDFWFEVVGAATLQTKEDLLKLISTVKPEYTLDYRDGNSSEEINLHDMKSVYVAKAQLQLYKDKYFEQFASLKKEYDSKKININEYQERFDLLRLEYMEEVNVILKDNYGHQEEKFKTYEPYYNPFIVVERTDYSVNIDNRGYVFQDPYKEIPVFRLPLRDPVNIEKVDKRIKEYKKMIEEGDTNSIPDIFFLDLYTHEGQEGKFYYVSSKDSLLLSSIALNGENDVKRREKIVEMTESFQHDLEMETRTFPELILTDIAVSLSNRVNTIKLNMQKSPAHQYLGSEDVVISLSFIAKSREEVSKFDDMISYVKSLETRYANIIDMPIMKFHNDIANLVAVDGVGYQDYVVSTIPNMPGAYEINLTLIGYHKAPEGFESVNRIHANKVKKSPEPDMADYFELKELLRFVNLYPDLELPKYNELPINSYLYDKHNEEFVDPDFYAMALTTTFTEYIEDAISNTIFNEVSHIDDEGNKAVTAVNYEDGTITTEGENISISNTEEDEEEYKLRKTRTSKERFIDSVHDMIVYGKKGRLIRAFPTFYIMLIDEGERLWWWRLHDNFYEYNGVKSIDVVRSRKIAADTCMIHMSNSRGNLTKAEIDYQKHRVEYSFFEALWKMTPWEQLRDKTLARNKDFNHVQLEAGARVHLRIGYGSSPADLPILFNGTITEVNIDENEDIIFVAQSDAIELLKPLQVKPGSSIGAAKEPARIIGDMIQKMEGSFWKKFTKGKFAKENALGLEHFGSGFKPEFWENNEYFKKKYQDLVFNNIPFWLAVIDAPKRLIERFLLTVRGKPRDHLNIVNVMKYTEITQNIHPGSSRLKNTEKGFGYDDAFFNMTLYGKTPYDVLQSCAMAIPNFIGAVHPFGFRSTIFYGHPTWDLAYDYSIKYENGKPKRNADGTIANEDIIENVKTFRQLHIYDDFSDIISNQIGLNSEGVYTIVKPVMIKKGGENKELQEVYVDKNIYPNVQKLITIDTSVDTTGGLESNVWGIHLNWKNEEICAYRIASSALRDFVKEMYNGYLLVTGDPTVKPYDYVFISDIRNDMSGMFEVEQVIHTLNKDVGFVTAITPDPIVVINEGVKEDINYYMYAKNLANNIVANVLTPKLMSLNLHLTRFLAGYGLIQVLKLIKKDTLLKPFITTMNAGKKIFAPGIEVVKKIRQSITRDKITGAINNMQAGKMQKLARTTIGKTDDLVNWFGKTKTIMKAGAQRGVQAGQYKRISYLLNNADDLNILARAFTKGRKAVKIADNIDDLTFVGKAAYHVTKTGTRAKNLVKGFVASPYFIIAMIIIEFVVSEKIRDYLQTKEDNKQVVTIVPLKKNGREYIAGLDGHAGSVLGDEKKDLDTWFDKVVNFIFDVDTNNENKYLLKEWGRYKQDVDKQIQERLIRKLEDTQVGRDIEEGEPDNSMFGDTYTSPREQVEQVEGDNRLEWNVNAYQKSVNQEFTMKTYKGIPLQAHFVDLLKSLEEELNIELQLSNNPLKTSDDRTDLLYDAGLAVSIDLKNVKGNKEYIKQEIIEKAELGGFYNHGIAAGEDIVHLDLGLKKRWNLNY